VYTGGRFFKDGTPDGREVPQEGRLSGRQGRRAAALATGLCMSRNVW